MKILWSDMCAKYFPNWALIWNHKLEHFYLISCLLWSFCFWWHWNLREANATIGQDPVLNFSALFKIRLWSTCNILVELSEIQWKYENSCQLLFSWYWIFQWYWQNWEKKIELKNCLISNYWTCVLKFLKSFFFIWIYWELKLETENVIFFNTGIQIESKVTTVFLYVCLIQFNSNSRKLCKKFSQSRLPLEKIVNLTFFLWSF